MYKFDNRFYADVRIEDRFSTGIMYRNGILESSKTRNEKRAFIRVFDGNIWYYASTSEVKNVQTELNNLYKQATPSKNILDNPIVKKFQVNKDVLMKFENNSVRNVSLNEKQALVNRMLPLLHDSGAAMSVALYSDSNSVYEFYSSKGADIKYDYQLAGALRLSRLRPKTISCKICFTTQVRFQRNQRRGRRIKRRNQGVAGVRQKRKTLRKRQIPRRIISPCGRHFRT